MATQMTDRLYNLYVDAVDRDASLMHASAVSACSRWCTPTTSHSEVQGFISRQVASLEGLNDPLSREVRDGWQWLAGELGPAPVRAPESARLLGFASRRDRVTAGATQGLRFAA